MRDMNAVHLHETTLFTRLLGPCLISLGLLSGCAGTSPTAPTGFAALPAMQGEVYHLRSVPFYADDTDQCGPATLASVLTYWGFPTEPPVLREEIYMSRLGGSLPMDLLLAAQARGMRAQTYSGTIENLKTELKAGHPVLALLNLGSARFPQGHYVVVVGYDDLRQGLYIHSGLQRDSFVSYKRFVQGWEKSGRWVLLILPPSMQGRNRI
jgi:ABC-type bacteriocin/lantibiotic exporter with double-glycine peptidase domain